MEKSSKNERKTYEYENRETFTFYKSTMYGFVMKLISVLFKIISSIFIVPSTIFCINSVIELFFLINIATMGKEKSNHNKLKYTHVRHCAK